MEGNYIPLSIMPKGGINMANKNKKLNVAEAHTSEPNTVELTSTDDVVETTEETFFGTVKKLPGLAWKGVKKNKGKVIAGVVGIGAIAGAVACKVLSGKDDPDEDDIVIDHKDDDITIGHF